MEKIIEALKENIRVNTADNTVEIFNDYGVKMKLHVTDEQLEEFKKYFYNF